MKSQNDLIVMGSSVFLSLVMIVLCLTVFHRPVQAPTPPTPVTTSDAPLPTAAPVMVAALPQGSGSSTGRGGAFGAFGAPGGGGVSAGKANFMGGGAGGPTGGGKFSPKLGVSGGGPGK